MDELSFVDAHGVEVFYRRWTAPTTERGAVVISHGASEHSLRYTRFADALNEAGIAAYALDHRGHGRTAMATGAGRTGPGGLAGAVDDVQQLVAIAGAEVAGAPVALFGHSMGSILVQALVERPAAGVAGYVLSGSPGAATPGTGSAADALRLAVEAGMGDEPLDALGSFNAAFEPARTPHDWLSRDPAEVDAYIADPFCGDDMPLTHAYMAQLLELAADAMSTEGIARIPSDLAVLLVTGEDDPVSGMATRVRILEGRLRDQGLVVTARYYPGARHEPLNETNRHEVIGDIIGWLDALM